MIIEAKIGKTYYTGNSFNPEACEVTHLVGYADLDERDQRAYDTLGRQHGYDPRTTTFVWFRSSRKHNPAEFARVLPLDVFCGVVYATLDELYADRAAAPGPAGMLRATLPGER